jgi:putative phage-type endonuclease
VITATRLDGVEPGSDEWLRYITASKISAIVGLSPWESPFSLWHRMNGSLPADPETTEQDRGHRLEDAVCAWWADQHPEFAVLPSGMYVNDDRHWQAATPDKLAIAGEIIDALEAKTDASYGGEWGEELTDEIPPYYKCQAIWQLDTLGLQRCHVAVLTGGLRFRQYVVDYDREDAEFLRAAALDFLGTLARGEEPDIDSHSATYSTLRKLHPDIEDRDELVDQALADEFRAAVHAHWEAEQRRDLVTARVAKVQGNAHYAVDEAGKRFAVRKGNPPAVSPGGPKDQWKRSLII